ncbi:MAG: hypothetical protein JSS83_09205 [Cyanobacteria bacterium SZAS LIN-3]|nr:hypothetical protein [Cyanobacteria bacterium SZAS LIN-3]
MKGRVAATAWIFSIALVVAFVAGVPAARAQGEEETCCQPGRIESAKSIIAQAETFKMRASKFHTDSAALIRDAAKLQGQAARLDPSARKQYEADLAEFRRHAEAYRAHQAQVEQTMGFCKATQAQYQAMLAEYSLHTAIFHIPTIRPPHVCESMQMDMASADKLNNQLRVDQDRVNKSQGQLMAAEEKLIGAASHNAAADAPLQARARLLEAERQLTGEFAALKTEYDMLATQHQALTAAGIKPPTLTKVTGKIQSKTSTK